MRILHLIDPQSPEGGPCTLRLLADVRRHLKSASHEALIVGNGDCIGLARRCGVQVEGALCPPRAAPWVGRDLLQRFLNIKRRAGISYDLIQAWTAPTAAMAASVRPHRPSLATFHVGPGRGLSAAYARRAMSNAPQQSLLGASMAVCREYRAQGFTRSRISLMPPAVDPESSAVHDRAQVRQQWAAHPELNFADDVFVVGLLAEPATWTDVQTAVTIICRAKLAGRNVKLLVGPKTGTVGSRLVAQAMMGQLSLGNLMVVDDASEPWRIVHGLDAALFLGSGCRARPTLSPLPLLWALTAGVPCIAESTNGWSDMIEDGASGWLISPGDVNAAAERILRLYDDGQLAATVGANARQAARDTFNIDEYCLRLQHAYELLLADRAVQTMASALEPAELSIESTALV